MTFQKKDMIPTDCFAQCAHTILKTFEIRPGWATFSCFCGSQSHNYSCRHEYYDLSTLGIIYI